MEELDVKQILKCIYQRKNIFAYILLATILIGMLYTFIIKRPTYEVTTQILIDKADASIEDFIISKDILNNENIQPKFDKTSKIISIITTMNKPDEAFNVTNQYVEKLQTKLEEVYGVKNFKTVTTPQVPQIPNNRTYLKDILISIAAGMVIYAAYIMLVFCIKGILNEAEIENNLKVKVLGEVDLEKKKDKNTIISYTTNNNKIINELKRIEANIEFNKENKKPKLILVTSTEKNVGNTYITNNLANQYAKIYNKVLVIDTDIISKTLTEFYNEKETKGLTNILEEKDINKVEKLIQKTQTENLYFLPAGNNNIEEDVFLQENINTILEKLKNDYDVILIDSLPINKNIAPIHLANIADATIIVADSEKTKIENIEKAKTTIEKVGGKIAGVIINKVF